MDDQESCPNANLPLPENPLLRSAFRSISPGPFEKKTGATRPQQLLELVCKTLHASVGGLGMLSAEGDILEHVTFGIPAAADAELRRTSWCNDFIQFLLRQPGSIHRADLTGDHPEIEVPAFFLPMGPFLGLPLTFLGHRRGALYLARSPGGPPFRPEDEETVLALHGFLEQASLFEEARLLAQLRLLNQVAQAAAGSLELPPILAVAARELDWHFPLHACAVWLLDEGEEGSKPAPKQPAWSTDSAGPAAPATSEPRLKLADTESAGNERAEKLGFSRGLRLTLGDTPFAACLKDGQAVYTDLTQAAEQGSALARNLAERGGNSSFAVALRAGDRTVGVLQSVCTRPTGFTNEQVQLLYLVADLLGPAISNCQLYGRLRKAYEELRQAQNQLVQAEKMRALGELAGGMAHDFNNSLCGVLGFLDLALTDRGLTQTVRGYLESAHTSALDAAHTVSRVQNFARWQRNELSVQALDFNKLVRQTVELTRHKWEGLVQARGTPITVEMQTQATGWVSGSASELREVFTNLIFNAVDAMPQGGRLTVRTWSTTADVYLSVRDTGVGMSEVVRQRLFEPFFTTKGERGNGLGLSVTFGIIQRHGGEIIVDSEVGQGSVFVVRLPAANIKGDAEGGETDAGHEDAETHVPAPAGANGLQVRESEQGGPRGGLRVLVVEDEESIRRFLSTALTQLGHRPRVTADAQEGLAAFAEEHFDVVLTDLGLPDISGEEVARAVTRQSPATPVILLTGWSDQLRNEAKELEGVTQILGKPVTLDTLATTLSRVCPGAD